MARRRKTRRTRTTRRRRVSGFGGSDLQIALGVAFGAVGGAFVNSQVAKMTKPIDPKIVAGAEVVGGAFLAMKAKSPLLKGVGYGLVGTGANTAAKSFGMISGFRALAPINGIRRVAGIADRAFIGKPTRMSGANAFPPVTGNKKFPSASVINGVYVNGHGDGSAI